MKNPSRSTPRTEAPVGTRLRCCPVLTSRGRSRRSSASAAPPGNSETAIRGFLGCTMGCTSARNPWPDSLGASSEWAPTRGSIRVSATELATRPATSSAIPSTTVPRSRGPDSRRGTEDLLVDDRHLVRGLVQPTSAVGRDGDDVLDPNTEPVRQVDAGFDGEAHTGFK